MFLIEQLIYKHEARIERYERARAKWVAEGENDHGYNYRSDYDYDRKHFHPNDIFNVLKFGSLLVLIGVLVLGFLYWVVVSSAEQDRKEREAENAIVEGKNCKAFNKGDHVKIQEGEYANGTGIIVGGCDPDKPYQVQLDDGVMIDFENDGQESINVGKKIVEVESKNYLVVIELPEDKEK